ncbi:MAG: hypothetical protein M3Q98_13045 [Actinomycetota bacterium]|nr:hypothetical protein [Actinomycetota bacterium]
MRTLTRSALGAAIVGGIVLLTYVQLRAHVWSGDQLDGWELGGAFGAAAGFQAARDQSAPRSARSWLLWLLDKAGIGISWVGFLYLLQLGFNLLGGGPGMTQTEMVLAAGALIAAGSYLIPVWTFGHRFRFVQDEEREDRLAEARRQARENVEQFTKDLKRSAVESHADDSSVAS